MQLFRQCSINCSLWKPNSNSILNLLVSNDPTPAVTGSLQFVLQNLIHRNKTLGWSVEGGGWKNLLVWASCVRCPWVLQRFSLSLSPWVTSPRRGCLMSYGSEIWHGLFNSQKNKIWCRKKLGEPQSAPVEFSYLLALLGSKLKLGNSLRQFGNFGNLLFCDQFLLSWY